MGRYECFAKVLVVVADDDVEAEDEFEAMKKMIDSVKEVLSKDVFADRIEVECRLKSDSNGW